VMGLLLVAVATWNYFQPIPAVAAASSGPDRYVITGTPPRLPWPTVGAAAVGASDLGLIATSGDVSPTPAASVAKVMTALVLLADKPLAAGQSGPVLIITDEDVATYMTDAAQQQSVVQVVAGERLDEYQALEALETTSRKRWLAGMPAR
jgi:serine-type D-Ala-D-Ala carboxypeptidase (penicillin-binding protein 5/6)